MSDVFRGADLPTLATTLSLIRNLSGVDPTPIDCCPSSCIAFTGDFADAEECHICQAPRFVTYPSSQMRPA